MTLQLLHLGWRLRNRSSYEARLRSAVLFAGVALATAVVLCGLSLPGAVAAKHQRQASLDVAYAEKGSSGARGLGNAELGDRRWNGHSVVRTVIATQPDGKVQLTLPGVDRLPSPGDVVASPALLRKAESDPVLGSLLSAYRVVGEIDSEGLATPDELRMVIGVPWNMKGLRPISRIGTPEDAATQPVEWVVGSLILVLIASTALGLVVLCTRLGSRDRVHRVVALRQLGLSEGQVRFTLASDTTSVVLPASVAGIAAYSLFVMTDGLIPTPGLDYFGADLGLPIWRILLVSALVLVASGAAAMRELTATAKPSRRRRLSRIGPMLLIAGLGGLALVPPLSGPKQTTIMMWISVASVAVGAAGSAAPMVAAFSRYSASRARSGGWLVGLRINAAEPGTGTRIVGYLAALVVFLTATVGLMNMLVGGTNERREVAHGALVVAVSDFGGQLSAGELSSVPGVSQAVPVLHLKGDRDTVLAAAATCSELEALVQEAVPSCTNAGGWLTSSGSSAILSQSTSVTLPDHGPTVLPDRKQPLEVGVGVSDLLDGLLLVPAVDAPDHAGAASRYLVRVDARRYPETLARFASLSPYMSASFGSNTDLDTDTQEYTEQIGWLTAGSAVALAFAWLGLVLGVSGDAESRRSRIRGLSVLGAPRIETMRAHVAMNALPTLLMALVASALAVFVNVVMTIVDERAAGGWEFFVSLIAISLGMSVVTGALTLPTSLRPVYDNEGRS